MITFPCGTCVVVSCARLCVPAVDAKQNTDAREGKKQKHGINKEKKKWRLQEPWKDERKVAGKRNENGRCRRRILL